MKIKYKFHDISSSIYLGRDDTAQTCDFLVPNQAFYLLNYISNLFYLFFFLFSFHFRIAIFPDTYAPPIGRCCNSSCDSCLFCFSSFCKFGSNNSRNNIRCSKNYSFIWVFLYILHHLLTSFFRMSYFTVCSIDFPISLTLSVTLLNLLTLNIVFISYYYFLSLNYPDSNRKSQNQNLVYCQLYYSSIIFALYNYQPFIFFALSAVNFRL